MQETVNRWGDEMQRAHGMPVQIRLGLHSGEVVVRSIDNDLHMDYSAIGQTTHLAARMEQMMARPGSVLGTGETLHLAEGYVQVKALGPVPIKGLQAAIEVFEIVGGGLAGRVASPPRARADGAGCAALGSYRLCRAWHGSPH
jgi:class 3 adenylate cyclase